MLYLGCPIKENCKDEFSKSVCRRVSYANRCDEAYFARKCCKTCSRPPNY